MAKCKGCRGEGSIMSKAGGIGLRGDLWHIYSARVRCWDCGGTGEAPARGEEEEKW